MEGGRAVEYAIDGIYLHFLYFNLHRCCVHRSWFQTEDVLSFLRSRHVRAERPNEARPIRTQNLGNSLPGTNNLSTLFSVMTAMRITPPDDPSRDIARESATEYS